MNRRQFLALSATAAVRAQTRRQPNIVLLLTDDQRFDTLSALGHPDVRTPNMDRLAARGVLFTHACTQGGLHGAICQPSRAQLMSGRSVFRVHKELIARERDPNPAYVTFPQQLRAAGYQTFATGKWHNGPALFNRTFADGGSVFFGGMDDHLKTHVNDYDPAGAYPKDKIRIAPKFSSEAFTDTALGFLERRDQSKPYFLYVAYTSPHDPRMAPAQYASMYSPDTVRMPKNFLPEHPFDSGVRDIRDELLAPYPRTEPEVRKHIAAYYAMISEVDAQIGRILDAVDDNTYVIWAADNGLAVGQHGLIGKQNLYDHSWRVPMVISGPGIPKGRRADTLCHIMDICPTIAEFAGVDMPADIDARSLRPALRDGKSTIRDSVIATYANMQRAIRTDRWKLILYNIRETRHTQLFDLKNDPAEMNNLAGKPEHANRIAELKATLQRQLKAAGDKTDLDAPVWMGLKEL